MRIPGLDFVAIDFETANRSRASICAVGVASVKDGQVVDARSWLVRPLPTVGGGLFDRWNVRIHGITPDMVADAPTFDELFPEMLAVFGDRPLVAHNASFDRGCMTATCAESRLPAPANPWECTMLTARRLLPGLVNHKLPTVARALGVRQEHHHDAGDDALVAAQIRIALAEVGQPAR